MTRKRAFGLLGSSVVVAALMVARAMATATTPVPDGGAIAITAPPGWSASAGAEAGRFEVLWAAAQNRSLDPEALSRTTQYRDYSVWKDVPHDRVLVRVGTAFSPAVRDMSLPDAAFPLDWSHAERLPDDWGFAVWQLRFSLRQVPYVVVAHIGPDATPLDWALVRAVIATVRPAGSAR